MNTYCYSYLIISGYPIVLSQYVTMSVTKSLEYKVKKNTVEAIYKQATKAYLNLAKTWELNTNLPSPSILF